MNRENAEEAQVPDNGAIFTESQHLALLESAVAKETSALVDAKNGLETQVAALTSEKAELSADLEAARTKLDVTEAEKAAAVADAEAARQELADFKADIARKAEIAELQVARVARVKAANANLPEAFFTEERQGRWAAMSEESFEDFVASVTATAGAFVPPVDGVEAAKETAALSGDGAPKGARPQATFLGLQTAMRGINVAKEG